ncbi:MAG TPA: ADP-dependent glucokinase/phosphofructokinase, partial [Thermomicrobiales bacterium]|nr:ADP-dependent glucokinase/phosphofructokinase [Thermomicrobiales bacterium]
MEADIWRERHAAALRAAEARLAARAAAPGPPRRIACGFTNNVDRIVALDGDVLAALANDVGADVSGPVVTRIATPADCVAGLLQHVAAGAGSELPVDEAGTARWIAASFAGRTEAAGTGARAANTLARLGFHALLHVTSLSCEQASLLDASGRLLIPTADGLRRPEEAARPEDPTMEHVVFEYPAGLTVALPERTVVAPRANRVITAYDPVNARLPLAAAYIGAVADPANGVDAVIISGYNQTANATICAAKIEETLAILRGWREARPHMLIHLELGATPDRDWLRAVFAGLAPHVDSVGLNVEELAAFLDHAVDSLAPAAMLAGMAELRHAVLLPRLNLHTQDYCLTLTAGDPAREQRALLYGSLVAGAHARTGAF